MSIHSYKPLLGILLLLIAAEAGITQLNFKNYNQKVQEAPFTIVYFYSSSCNYCKEFTPTYEKLQNNKVLNELGVALTKIDGTLDQDTSTQLGVYSYPSLLFYRKGVELPINMRRSRSEKEIVDFVTENVKSGERQDLLPFIRNMTVQQRVQGKAAIFYGHKNSTEYWQWDTIAKRDGFIGWSFVEANTTTSIVEAGDKQITDLSNLSKVQTELAAIYARIRPIEQESWLNLMQKKMFSIVYVNKHGNKKTVQLLDKLAKQFPQANFIDVNGDHDEYKTALRQIGIHDEQNIISVDKKYDAIYIAPEPYTEQSLRQFIHKAKEHKLDIYLKTEKSEKPNKLTRLNYDQKMNTRQDVLLFLYDKTDPISKQLMKLFQFLVLKLKHNTNLLLLRCDVGMNQIEEKLGFVLKPTPKLVFYRNRMKDYPIHFRGKTLSATSVIDFIMENTTFDFEDEWAEL